MEHTPREFEKLVARIEGALAPIGAVIKSPDHLRDVFTGELREVDVSIRFRAGSVDLLITLECRDRARTQDVTWIEQLATKQRHIGAACTIAVSSTGFSQPALAAAKVHGISTRMIDDITDAEILAWADTLEVEEVETNLELGRLRLDYHQTHDGTLDAPSVEQWTARGFEAEIFLERVTGRYLCLTDLVAKAHIGRGALRDVGDAVQLTIPPKTTATFMYSPLAILARDVPRDGNTVQKTVWLNFAPEEIAVSTTSGLRDVKALGFELTLSSSCKRIPTVRVVRYTDQDRVIADVAERAVPFGPDGRQILITSHRAGPNSEPGSGVE